VESQMRLEIDACLAGRIPTYRDLADLGSVRNILDESMRLYPPIWVMMRDAIHSDEIGGYRIPGGAVLMISPYVTHRLPDFWENPTRFDPERFSNLDLSQRHRYAFFPFGGGGHQCIGNHLAMLEAQLTLIMVAQKCTLHLVPGQNIEMDPMITLRPRPGIRVTVVPHEAAGGDP
jgi:cytochrome P450